MVREETLRALISARETISRSMKQAAEGTNDLRESMAEAAASSSVLVGAVDTTEDQVSEYERAVASLSRESIQAAAQQQFMGEGIDNAGEAALEAAGAMQVYQSRVDEAGDESAETAAQSMGLAAAMRTAATAAGQASVNIGPFNTNVRRAAIALPALIALLGSFAGVLFGVAAAATAAAGALMMLFAGGLLGRAQMLADASSDIENTMEALGEMATQFASAMMEAIEPVQTLANQEAVINVLNGLLRIINDLAQSAERLAPVFSDAKDQLSATFWAEEAKGIAEVEQMISDLMPILVELTFWVLTRLPDLFAWLRKETERVAPTIGDFTQAIIRTTVALSEIGGTLMKIVLPPLNLLLDSINLLLNALTMVPEPLYAASVAFTVAAIALQGYSGSVSIAAVATWSLNGAISALVALLATITGPISGTVAIIAALIAAIVGVITYFDLWSKITDALIWTWNRLISIIEFAMNTVIATGKAIYDFLGPLTLLLGPIGWAIALLTNWSEVMDAVRGAIEWARDAWESFVDSIMKWVGPILDAFGLVSDSVSEVAGDDAVDLSGTQIERGGTESGTDQESARQRADEDGSPAASQQAQNIRGQGQENNFDFRGADLGGNSEREVEKAVERALDKRDERSGNI